jgi:hypothetical protein
MRELDDVIKNVTMDEIEYTMNVLAEEEAKAQAKAEKKAKEKETKTRVEVQA